MFGELAKVVEEVVVPRRWVAGVRVRDVHDVGQSGHRLCPQSGPAESDGTRDSAA